jgi:hypothetical protein
VQWPADAQLELYAWKAGYSVEVVDLQSPFPADLTLVLLDEGAVYGSVVLPDGHTAGQGIRVVAAPTHERSPGRRVFERACQGDPYACASTTDANGAYMINRLGRGREYSLLASGGGVSTSARVGPIAAGDQVKHDITVRTVYSLAVDLYDARTKQRLTVSPHFRYGTGFRVSLKGTELELADVVMSAKPFFANCSTFKRGLANSIDDYFLSDSLLPEAGPISVKVALPGYQPWSGSLNAKRLSDVAERQRIELTPAAYGFGSLVLILPSCLRRPAPQADLFTATLTLVSDGAKSIQFKVDPTESGRVEFDGIPYGSYAASLAGFCQGGTYPAAGGTPPVVTIGESPTLLEIPELYLGSLLLDPQRPDGSSYAGYLDALVLEGAGPVDEIPRPASSRVFLGPPYRLDILNPGEYTIVLNYPVGSEAHVVCSVSSNSETRCLLHVP